MLSELVFFYFLFFFKGVKRSTSAASDDEVCFFPIKVQIHPFFLNKNEDRDFVVCQVETKRYKPATIVVSDKEESGDEESSDEESDDDDLV